jgi:hypothetical protein
LLIRKRHRPNAKVTCKNAKIQRTRLHLRLCLNPRSRWGPQPSPNWGIVVIYNSNKDQIIDSPQILKTRGSSKHDITCIANPPPPTPKTPPPLDSPAPKPGDPYSGGFIHQLSPPIIAAVKKWLPETKLQSVSAIVHGLPRNLRWSKDSAARYLRVVSVFPNG